MAHVQKIEGKKGISFKLTAFAGYDSHGKQIRKTKTWRPEKGMTAKQTEKQAMFEAELFEQAVNGGQFTDDKITFAEFSQQWLHVNKARFAPITYIKYE